MAKKGIATINKDISNPPEHASEEMAKLIMEVSSAMINKNARALILLRRKIRYRLFRIKDAAIKGETPKKEHDSGLRKWMELQFPPGVTWNEYTFEWDVSAHEPLKLIIPMEWDGAYDSELYEKCGLKKCSPPAFTKQK